MTSLLKTYKTMPLDLARGEDVWVWDTAGRKYMDLYAGHAVCSTGHCHPHVVKAVQEQVGKLIFYSNVAPYSPYWTLSAISFDTSTAESGMPLPIALASVTRSAFTP